MRFNKQGSILVIVVLATVVVGTVAAGVLGLINTQRRVNLRKELQLQATNAAEAAVDYSYSYLINEIEIGGVAAAPSVPSSGSTSHSLPTAAASFISAALPAPPGFSGPTGMVTFSTPTIRVLEPTSSQRYFVDPFDPANANDPNINQWVVERVVPIVCAVTASQGGQSVTAYVEKRISLREVALFQHAIFFSNQLQLHRGYRPLGDIHANGPLLINAHNGDTARYTGFVSTAGRFYRGSTMNNDVGGVGGDAYGYTRINAAGDLDFAGGVSPVATGNDRITVFKDNNGASDLYETLPNTFDSRMTNWKDEAIKRFNGHLVDASHQKPALVPTGSAGYKLDVASTIGTNEFNNGPYSLIEPFLPIGNAYRKSADANRMNLEANASLILRVEALPRASWPTLKNSSGSNISRTTDLGGGVMGYSDSDLKNAQNIADVFVVKAYKYQGGPNPAASTNPTLLPVRLPNNVIGVVNLGTGNITSSGVFEPYTVSKPNSTSANWSITSGLHDPRLGRGVDLLTINMGALKTLMEADPATLTGDAQNFRTDFTVSHSASPVPNDDWNGIVYVEFPTSLDVSTTASPTVGTMASSHPFQYGTPETRHPDRASNSDSRAARTDNIVPIAPELRRYPSSATDANISNRYYAIPALQIVDAKQLPNPHGNPGFTIATNAPLYLKGAYNSDGSYATGTKIEQTAANAYAQADTGEVSAAIFCDTFTVLSDSWATNRGKSFHGVANASTSTSNTWGGRGVTKTGTNRIEIGACIATGEFPIFEFFFHALENYSAFNSDYNPIIVKGSTVGMFHSEIQHIKGAYGRDTSKDIQYYWHAHGAHAFTTVRYHQFLVNGNFPPGTPIARVSALTGFRILRKGDATDRAYLTSAGF